MNELRIRIHKYLQEHGKHGIMIHCRTTDKKIFWKYRTRKGNIEYRIGNTLQEAWENLQETRGNLEQTEQKARERA